MPKTACLAVTLPRELARHLWRLYCRINDETDLETSASGIAETALELFLELTIEENESLLKRCLNRVGKDSRRKVYSLPPDVIRRFERRCTELNDRDDRQGKLKPSVIAEAAFVNFIERDFEGVAQCLKRFNVRKRRK